MQSCMERVGTDIDNYIANIHDYTYQMCFGNFKVFFTQSKMIFFTKVSREMKSILTDAAENQ